LLYDMSEGAMKPVERTSFAAEAVLERSRLLAALRDQIDALGDDLLVVAEEFGETADLIVSGTRAHSASVLRPAVGRSLPIARFPEGKSRLHSAVLAGGGGP